jgi:hypothetical protein
MSVSFAALIVGAAIGWLIARLSFTSIIAELNTRLLLERQVNKQLSQTFQVDGLPGLIQAPHLTAPAEPMREPTALSG